MPGSADILNGNIESSHHSLFQFEHSFQPHVVVYELDQHWEIRHCGSDCHEDHHRQQIVHACKFLRALMRNQAIALHLAKALLNHKQHLPQRNAVLDMSQPHDS